jgi:hypothetical protein
VIPWVRPQMAVHRVVKKHAARSRRRAERHAIDVIPANENAATVPFPRMRKPRSRSRRLDARECAAR